MSRQSAAVYRRRRLALLLLLVLVLAAVGGVVWLAIAQPWSASVPADRTPAADADAVTTPAGKPSASAGVSPQPSETPGIAACTPEDVTVTAVTDADTYPAEALPQLSILLANTGARDCTLNVGSSTQTFTVSSGEDVWWRSTDCQSESSDMIVTLEAGSSVPSASPVVWDRTRSSTETCEEQNRPRAPGGGASYHVAVSIGGFSSETPKQILLR